jgi:hypothetical protein
MQIERQMVLVAGVVALLLSAAPAQAHHNDWAAPLVGGALGGYALGTLVSNSSHQRSAPTTVYESNPAPVYYTPAPVAAPVYTPVPSSSTIEAQLNQLDKLAAAGYITPAEYQTRRNAILNQL